jgi:hypothetical protein
MGSIFLLFDTSFLFKQLEEVLERVDNNDVLGDEDAM